MNRPGAKSTKTRGGSGSGAHGGGKAVAVAVPVSVPVAVAVAVAVAGDDDDDDTTHGDTSPSSRSSSEALDIVEPPSTFAPHHQYTLGVARRVLELRVRDKRNIYVAMRQQPPVNPNAFLPHYGLSAGEFAVWQILNERPRRSMP